MIFLKKITNQQLEKKKKALHHNPNAGKNLSDPNTWIFRLRKTGYGIQFFVRILYLDIPFFTFLLSEPDLDLNLALSELSDSKKIGYQSSISCPNFDIVGFIRSDFDPNLNFWQHYIIPRKLSIITKATTGKQKKGVVSVPRAWTKWHMHGGLSSNALWTRG